MSRRTFTPDWLAGAPQATALLRRDYASAEGRLRAVADARQRRVNPAVLDSLDATTEAQKQHRDALAEGAVCVVTGQQAGLFGGPLYTVYKAAAAIVNARALEQQTGHRCVPVFWLQNEDHDFAEIGHCSTLTQQGHLERLAIPGDPGPADRPIRARVLGPEVGGAVMRLCEQLAELTEAKEALALVQSAWRPETSPDVAFRRWLEALFGPHGLLIVDPSHPDLDAAAAPIHRRAIDDREAIARLLCARAEELEAAGYAVQVHVREGAPLSFVHPDGRERSRTRVLPDADGFRTPDGRRLTLDQVLAGPHSTSALLRPILQDTWLPTAAIVGGPGEIAYFSQLPPLYEHFDLPMPTVVPRARFLVRDETSDRLLGQLGLSVADLSEPPEQLLAGLADPGDRPSPDALLAALRDPIAHALTDLAPHAADLEPGLAKAVDKTRATMERAAEKLVGRYRLALGQQDSVRVERLERLRARLAPGGAPQERVHGWPWYGARYGVDGFIQLVLDAVVPFDGTLREISP